MKLLIFFFALIVTIPVVAQDRPIEEGWKGIRVLKTTRAEVEQILRVPTTPINATETSYETSEGIVHIIYTAARCSDAFTGRYNLPNDTVFSYRVIPKPAVPLSKLKWNKRLYARLRSEHQLDVHFYEGDKNGVTVTTTYDGKEESVGTIAYFATDEMKTKRLCVLVPIKTKRGSQPRSGL